MIFTQLVASGVDSPSFRFRRRRRSRRSRRCLRCQIVSPRANRGVRLRRLVNTRSAVRVATCACCSWCYSWRQYSGAAENRKEQTCSECTLSMYTPVTAQSRTAGSGRGPGPGVSRGAWDPGGLFHNAVMVNGPAAIMSKSGEGLRKRTFLQRKPTPVFKRLFALQKGIA